MAGSLCISQVQVDVKKKKGRPKGSTNKNKRVKPVTPESPAAKAAKMLSQRSRLFIVREG